MCLCFCLCLVCFESRRQLLRLVEVWDSLVLNQLRVFFLIFNFYLQLRSRSMCVCMLVRISKGLV